MIPSCKGTSDKSSHRRLWGCGVHLILLAKGAGVQLLGHVTSMTKPLLANQSSARKCRSPSQQSSTYLSTCTLTYFRTARLAGAGTQQRELTLGSVVLTTAPPASLKMIPTGVHFILVLVSHYFVVVTLHPPKKKKALNKSVQMN